MWISSKRTLALIASVGLVLAGSACVARDASAASKGKSVQTEAEWVGYDAETKTVTAKVKKKSKYPSAVKKLIKKDKELKKALDLKTGKEYTFEVKPEGSILTKTTVAINGKRGELTDIKQGKTVNIYWRPGETDPSRRKARKIDVILSEAELEELYGN